MTGKRISLATAEGVQASKLIALHCIGLLVSLRDGYMSMDEAERFFLPWVVRVLTELDISLDVVNLVELGCELEDVKSLLPDRLEDNINSLIFGFSKFLKSYVDADFIKVDVLALSSNEDA